MAVAGPKGGVGSYPDLEVVARPHFIGVSLAMACRLEERHDESAYLDTIGEIVGFVWDTLHVACHMDFTSELGPAFLYGSQQWLASIATATEHQRMQVRERDLREKVDAQFPGSLGVLRRLSTWRGTWCVGRGPVSKQTPLHIPRRQWNPRHGLGPTSGALKLAADCAARRSGGASHTAPTTYH